MNEGSTTLVPSRDMGSTETSDKTEPQSRGVILVSFRSAADDLFGADGLRAIGERLDEAARAATVAQRPLALAWYPTDHLVSWYDAVFEGPAGRDAARFRAWVDLATDHGFGRIRRTLLQLVGPEGLVTRAAELWRHDHSTGTLAIVDTHASGARAVLRDHPFTRTPLTRQAITEVLRHILSLARGVRNAKKVTESHTVDKDGALAMQFTWQ